MGFIHCNLRVLMAEKNLNIKDVYDNTTLSRTTISNLYNNYANGVKYETLLQLCTYLDCQPGDLLTFYNVNINLLMESLSEKPNIESLYLEEETIQTIKAFIVLNYTYETNQYEVRIPFSIKAQFHSKLVLDFVFESEFPIKEYLKKFNAPYIVKNYIQEKTKEFLVEEILNHTETDLGYGPFQIQYQFLENK